MGTVNSSRVFADVYSWIGRLKTKVKKDRIEPLPLIDNQYLVAEFIGEYRNSVSLSLRLGDKVIADFGEYLIEKCGEEEMQQKLHPFFSRLSIYTFMGVTDKYIKELKQLGRGNKSISNTDILRLIGVDIGPRSIDASIYKKAFNTLFCAACYVHLKGTGDIETNLKKLAGETLRIVRPEMASSLMKCLASKFTEILLEYKSESINNDFKISYSSTLDDIWTIHCSSPRLSMERKIHYKEISSELHYTLSHQQVDCKLELHHAIKIRGNLIEVQVKIQNLRCKAFGLDSHKQIPDKFERERYFPAKIAITTGPETGRFAFHAVNSGASSSNPTVAYSERTTLEKVSKAHVEVGIPLNFKVMGGKTVRHDRRNTIINERSNWHFEPSAHDNTHGRFQWTLSDHSYQNFPVYSYFPERRDEKYRAVKVLAHTEGENSPFTEERGIEFGGDMYQTPINWTFKKEIKGKTLDWFVECAIWMAYYPYKDSIKCMETRYQKFRELVQFPLKESSS